MRARSEVPLDSRVRAHLEYRDESNSAHLIEPRVKKIERSRRNRHTNETLHTATGEGEKRTPVLLACRTRDVNTTFSFLNSLPLTRRRLIAITCTTYNSALCSNKPFAEVGVPRSSVACELVQFTPVTRSCPRNAKPRVAPSSSSSRAHYGSTRPSASRYLLVSLLLCQLIFLVLLSSLPTAIACQLLLLSSLVAHVFPAGVNNGVEHAHHQLKVTSAARRHLKMK